MLVTAVDVVDEANDNAMLAPMMERAEETTGTKAQTTLADAGYFAGSLSMSSDYVRLGGQGKCPSRPLSYHRTVIRGT